MVDIKNQNLLEKIFLAYVREKPTLTKFTNSHYFKNDKIKSVYEVFIKFYREYKETPTNKQLWELLKTSSIQLKPDELKQVVDIDLDEYDFDWVEDKFEAWVSTRTFDDSLNDAIEYLKATKVSDSNYRDVIQEFKTIINDRNNINLNFDMGLNFYNPEHHAQAKLEDLVSSGYSSFDEILGGGWQPKTLNCLMGESNIGKSIFLANFAANAVKQGYNTAFVTAEMADRKVIKRLGANLLNVSIDEYDKLSWDESRLKGKIADFKSASTKGGLSFITPGELYVKEYPTSTATVPDLENYLLELQDQSEMKLKFVVIDYINILANYRNPNTEDTYNKIKQIAEDLRGMVSRNDWIGLSVTQVNASGIGNTDLTASSISESKALFHTVDTLFGIIQTEQMYLEERYITKAIKLRDSGSKHVRSHWNINYNKMRLTEAPTE